MLFSIVYSNLLFKRISSASICRMIILLCMLSFALAEPPVVDSYLEAAQLSQGQQYLPPDLTVPSARSSKPFNTLSNQYLPPSTRGISQEYGPPDARQTLSSEYGLPIHGTSVFRSGISQEYGTPLARSSLYDSLNSDLNHSFSSAPKSSISQRYGAPSSRHSPSSLNNSPFQRSLPSSLYGTPQLRSSNGYARHASPVQKYGVPSVRSSQTQSKSISQEYGTPSNSYLQRSLGNSNSFSSRLQNPQFQSSGHPSQSYGIPARSLSTQYGTPSTRKTVPEIERSAVTSISSTNAYASSYPSARSLSLEYGPPSSRTTVPSQEYGPPEGSLDDQGYEYARNALEALNQQPANYEFAYKVSDDYTGSDFGHMETREQGRAEGSYFVLLPDGTKQVVEYEADEDGFKPRISVEPVDSADALSAEGPY